MSISRSQPSAGHPLPASERLHAVPDPAHQSTGERVWDERLAMEKRHQEAIEASFDRAEAYERLGDFEQALVWVDRAAAISGDLPAAYRARRARWARVASRPPRR